MILRTNFCFDNREEQSAILVTAHDDKTFSIHSSDATTGFRVQVTTAQLADLIKTSADAMAMVMDEDA